MYIIGGGGSGKSTLARQLGRTLDVEPFGFDTDVRADRRDLAGRDRWIIEGIFLFGIEPLLDRADLIVWLDLPLRIARRRIIVRHFWLSLLRSNRHRGLRLLWRFVGGLPGYYTEPPREPRAVDDWDAITRALTVERLEPHMEKVIHLRTPAAVRQFRASLHSRSRPDGNVDLRQLMSPARKTILRNQRPTACCLRRRRAD